MSKEAMTSADLSLALTMIIIISKGNIAPRLYQILVPHKVCTYYEMFSHRQNYNQRFGVEFVF
jgi:hypothetical protein